MKILHHFLEIMMRIEALLRCLVAANQQQQHGEQNQVAMAKQQLNYLDKQEVMLLLKISERQLYNLRKEAALPCRTIKGKLYFKLSDIEKISQKR